MEEKLKDLIIKLTNNNKTIATMESCTGGALIDNITNIEGSSSVIKFSAVTYSNEFKVKMGVSEDIINKYSVYSMETAKEMSKNIVLFTDADYGIGITGKLNRKDEYNNYGTDNQVFISIYDKDSDKYYNFDLFVDLDRRSDNKDLIVSKVIDKLLEIV